MTAAAEADRTWLSLYNADVPADFEPISKNGVEVFERGPKERPDAVATYYFDTEITFAEAAAEAHALAAALRDRFGVKAGDRVALMMQNVPAMPVAVHAVWLLGAAICPTNVMNKRRELVHQFSDAGVKVAICLESLYEVVDGVRAETPLEHVITVSELDYLDELPPALSDSRRIECAGAESWREVLDSFQGQLVTPADPEPDEIAMITYTSGTTGQAKGAMNTHRGVAHNSEVWLRWYHLSPEDVTVAMAPLFHITGLIAHLGAARIATTPLLLFYRYDAAELLRLVEKWKGTYIIGPLTAFIALLDHPDFERRDIGSLTKVGSGGAPVSPTVVDRYERETGVYLHNTYGLTESTSPTHLVPIGERAPVDPESGALSVGVPVCGAESKIVSTEDFSVEMPNGEIGEIVTRGPMICDGYWNRPDATAETIVDGWLRTGDVGKRDEEGWFWLVDRVKDMINVSGYKVWPRDVEDVLYQHPDVVEAAVVGVPDDYRGERVRAYVTLRPGSEATERALIAHCGEILAAYKRPREVVTLEEMPKTATGKILRRHLRQQARESKLG